MAKEPYLSQLIEKIKPDMGELRNSGEFGLKIYNKLAKQYSELALSGFPLQKISKKKKGKGRQKPRHKKFAPKPQVQININANYTISNVIGQ